MPVYIGIDIEFMIYASFISVLSVSHTFHDFLPAIYMQALDANTALSTMPGAEKASTGTGPEAFHSTLLGGIVSIGVFILLLPFLYIFLGRIYTSIEPLMAYIVGVFLLFLIFREENLPAIYTIILAGALGILTLNNNLGGSFILMPVFSGLFAIPAVATSLQENYTLPEQETESSYKGIKGSLIGLLSGLIAGIVPVALQSLMKPKPIINLHTDRNFYILRRNFRSTSFENRKSFLKIHWTDKLS
jgi:putative membrane protein